MIWQCCALGLLIWTNTQHPIQPVKDFVQVTGTQVYLNQWIEDLVTMHATELMRRREQERLCFSDTYGHLEEEADLACLCVVSHVRRVASD